MEEKAYHYTILHRVNLIYISSIASLRRQHPQCNIPENNKQKGYFMWNLLFCSWLLIFLFCFTRECLSNGAAPVNAEVMTESPFKEFKKTRTIWNNVNCNRSISYGKKKLIRHGYIWSLFYFYFLDYVLRISNGTDSSWFSALDVCGLKSSVNYKYQWRSLSEGNQTRKKYIKIR